MADNMIELVASLNVDDSANQINKVDIPLLQKKIEGIKIKCELDTNGISSIQSQLANISKNSKLDIPKVEVQTDTGQSAQNIENVAKSVEAVTNKVLTLKKTLADLDSRFVEAFKAVENPDGIINAERTMAVIQSRLSSLGTVTVTGKYNDQESEDSINKIIARIEAASGEVRELNFLLDSTGQKFEYIGGSYSDKGVGKIQQDLARLSKELANFEASHKSIETGLIEPLTTVRNAIIDLESGVGSVESAQKALDNLKTVAANIGSNLKSTGSSFNVFDNAANKAKNFDNTIKTLKIDIESLSPSTSKSSLVSQLDLAIERMNEFKDVESKSGRGVEWSQRYGEISSLLQNITNNLKVAQKEENASNKEFERAVREEEKQLAIEQKRVETARQLRESQQHDYWQGRFEETVKGMTAENQILKDMKKYYEDLNKAQKEVERQEKKTFQEDNKLANLQNRIKRLTADINSYAVANKRAVESTKQMTSGKSFADEWSRITYVMAKGADLTDRELKDLSADMAVFRKEAQAAGLAGASAFERFGNAFKLVSTYISANQVINMVTRNIREAVDELKTVDDRLTEISKTSDRTAESLKNLGSTSFDTASKYGRTASDYLLGVQEMSRAGFAEKASEDMAELSVLAQAAGDMTADLANQYLIATNAAYQYNGSVDKLNDSLDRQNYVTNHYALSMSDLAEATKIAASQAAQSGIGIDEMTAALSTMISTTQQGGEIAARSLRGILMNIQQVKGEVGDGEEDITSASLSKYEKAAEALGVSLKEVRNGAVALRDPMMVLDELASAFNKEADDSIKKANLISAIGGKYRGNQLSALLTNWDTYKDILNTFNSDQAVGSALNEAEKSANNWAGSLNKVKNSWSELVNQFINSDNAVSVIQSINRMIQSLTESAATGGLKTTANLLSDLVELISVFSEKVGTLPVLLAGIAGIGSFKGKGIFGTITDELDESVKHITVFKKQWADIQTNIKKSDTTGLSKIGIALEGVRLKAVATEIAVSALNAALTLGLSVALSLAVKGISTLVDKIVVTKEELDESRNIVAQDIQNLTQDIKELTDKKDDVDELLTRYKEIALSAEDISKNKDELIQIQDSIIDKFGAEKESLDLLNSSYDDAITKIKELSDAEYVEWQRQNASKIAKVEKVANLNVGWKQLESGRIVEPVGSYTETFYKGSVDRDNELVASLFKIKGVSQDIADIYKEIDGLDFLDDLFSNSVLLTGDIYQAQEQLGQLIDKYKNFEDYDNKTLNILEEHYRSIKEIIEDIDAYYKSVNQFTASDTKVFTLDFNNLKDLEQLNTTLVDARDKWFENMSDMSKETIETVDTITKALQTLATGNGLTHNDFWELVKIDKDNMLTDIKQIGDSFVLNQEQLVALKDTYIRQQIDSLKAENKSLQIKQNELQTTIDQSEVEMSILGARGLVNEESRKAMDNARKSVVQGKKNLEQYGEQIRYNNMLINEWTAKLGDTVDKTQLIKDLQEKADIAEKAMNTAIDSKLKALNDEKTVLESQKDVLNEQLEILETQRKKIEDIINDYETVGNIVKDEAERQIKTLEDEKKAQEDIVQAKIETLKESKEAQDKENALIEKELELKRKLSDLEKAKNTKVRTYSTERGYHFDVDREAVVSAEEEVSKAQQAYNQAVAEDLYDKQLESLEKEKDEITKNFDEQIKTVQEYSNLWADAIKEQTTAENERLAQQILGLAWREKINKADVSILNNFKSNLKQYNTQLTNLVNNEIKQLKNSITAKDEEIQAKQRQIKVWQDYKTEVQDAIERVKNKYSEYVDELGGVISAENLSYENREEALRNFIVTYEGLVDEIARQQGRIQDVHAGIYIDTNVSQVSSEMANFIDSYRSAIESMQKSLDESLTGYGIVNSAWDARLAAAANALRRGYSSGGVADYTGFAMLHGSKNSAETIFNATQSKELYDMVKTGKFSMQVANKAYEGIASALMTAKSKNTNNSNTIINLHQEFHNMHDGRKFAEEFNKNISQYWRTELTKSMVQ